MITRNILEADIVSHCSLRCTHCSVAAPYMRPSFYDIAEYEKDVHVLSKVLHLSQFRMLGGEPFLVPNLADYVRIARESGICDWVSVTTNGLALEKISEELLTSFDMIVVSIYHSISESQTDMLRRGLQKLIPLQKQGRFKNLVLLDTQDFRLAEVDARIEDDTLVNRIWKECAQKELCSGVRDGYVWRCTAGSRRQAYLKTIGADVDLDLLSAENNALAIHKPHLEERLRAYFHRDESYEMCHYCLGNSAKPVGHRQLTTQEIRERRPVHIDVRDMLKEEDPNRPMELNYWGDLGSKDKPHPTCLKCKMGTLHSKCDNEG